MVDLACKLGTDSHLGTRQAAEHPVSSWDRCVACVSVPSYHRERRSWTISPTLLGQRASPNSNDRALRASSSPSDTVGYRGIAAGYVALRE